MNTYIIDNAPVSLSPTTGVINQTKTLSVIIMADNLSLTLDTIAKIIVD